MNKKVTIGGCPGTTETETDWKAILEYLSSISTGFNFTEDCFNHELLEKFPESIGVMVEIIALYSAYFTLKDKGEEGYKDAGAYMKKKDDIRNFNFSFYERYRGLEGYFDPKTRNADIEAKNKAIKEKNFEMLVRLIGTHTKRYFLDFYLTNKIISKKYFLHLNYGISDPWESLKELYYLTARHAIADSIIEETTGDCIMDVKDAVAMILTRKPKESFRLLSNIRIIMKKYNAYTRTICTSGIGIQISPAILKIDTGKEGDSISLLDG